MPERNKNLETRKTFILLRIFGILIIVILGPFIIWTFYLLKYPIPDPLGSQDMDHATLDNFQIDGSSNGRLISSGQNNQIVTTADNMKDSCTISMQISKKDREEKWQNENNNNTKELLLQNNQLSAETIDAKDSLAKYALIPDKDQKEEKDRQCIKAINEHVRKLLKDIDLGWNDPSYDISALDRDYEYFRIKDELVMNSRLGVKYLKKWDKIYLQYLVKNHLWELAGNHCSREYQFHDSDDAIYYFRKIGSWRGIRLTISRKIELLTGQTPPFD